MVNLPFCHGGACGFDARQSTYALWCSGSTWDFDSHRTGSSPVSAVLYPYNENPLSAITAGRGFFC